MIGKLGYQRKAVSWSIHTYGAIGGQVMAGNVHQGLP